VFKPSYLIGVAGFSLWQGVIPHTALTALSFPAQTIHLPTLRAAATRSLFHPLTAKFLSQVNIAL
jgi:hypothetical protein